jgi:hypothetical protein
MTDTPTGTANDTPNEEHEPGTGPDVPADRPIAISATIGTAEHVPVKDRLLLPLLVPVLSAIAVGVLAVNISRVFLAGDSTAALFVAVFVTLAILGGASLLAAAPHMRTSSLSMVVALIVVIVTGAGLLTLGPSLGHEEGGETGYVEPSGPADATFRVEANASLAFNGEKNGAFSVGSGIVEIDLFGASGHTFAFREPEFQGFLLGPTPNPPLKGKVTLEPGTTYEFWCTIPGHAAAGMQGTLTAT